MSQVIQLEPGRYAIVLANGQQVQYRSNQATNLASSYASFEDWALISLPENIQHDFEMRRAEIQLGIASRRFDAVVGQRFTTPLALYSDAVVWCVCELAYAQLMRIRGFDQNEHAERDVIQREKAAMAWAEAARDYEITPDQRLATTETFAVAQLYSSPQRGWSR